MNSQLFSPSEIEAATTGPTPVADDESATLFAFDAPRRSATPSHPEWKLSKNTVRIGRAGVRSAREALRSARTALEIASETTAA